ncbi:MAG TPA: hypothetical protein VG297_14115 [Bryobacteraceae bacterium]|nr:hypothetical protein [Bryobacteraceae bacterium]
MPRWGDGFANCSTPGRPRASASFAPDVAFDDAEKYLPPLLAQRGKPIADVAPTLDWLRSIVEPVTPELYALF